MSDETMLKKNSTGDSVRQLQKALTEFGFGVGRIDGIFGLKTDAGVKEFQEAVGLPVDGVVTQQVWNALFHPEEAGTAELFLYGNPANPYRRHLLSTCIPSRSAVSRMELIKVLGQKWHMNVPVWQAVPPPTKLANGNYKPNWNSVALFFNLVATSLPPDYKKTTVKDARYWLDEVEDGFLTRANPTISEFMVNYWSTLSYGRFGFGVNTPRDTSGAPLIPNIVGSTDNSEDSVVNLVFACLDANAEAIWRAAGSLTREGRRFIPSIVLVHNYYSQAWATLWGYTRNISGQTYDIGRVTHVSYDLNFVGTLDAPNFLPVRTFWRILCHEYAHNFLDFGDLYGPSGCTGYWDLLGDSSQPGSMSEVCSVHKALIGWLSFKEVIKGPKFAARAFSLRPYTTSGEAIKVIPDPEHNPLEYFVLEYRKSTGNELWRPDRALPEEGLFIVHMNERLGLPQTFLMREAPYFDPEFADFSDNGGAQWTGIGTPGVLFPQGKIPGFPSGQGTQNAFTPETSPSSNFYGSRRSGLRITGTQVVAGQVSFTLEIDCRTRVGWTVSYDDRCSAGRFTPDSQTMGQEIFCRNNTAAALLEHRQGQWFVRSRQESGIGGWALGLQNREVVGDLDGDGLDEVYIRSPEYAGVLKWDGSGFNSITVQHNNIGGWKLGSDNSEFAADLDGDGKAELFIRSPRYAGVLKLIDNRLQLQAIQSEQIGEWKLELDQFHNVGRFTQPIYDEILVRNSQQLGLLVFDSRSLRLQLRSIQNGAVGGWKIGRDNDVCVGDFDGDGIDEIYVRSPKYAGVLKWDGSKFASIWIRKDNLENLSSSAEPTPLTARDRSYSGQFLPDKYASIGYRDGILHRSADTVALLTWESGSMRVRMYVKSPFGGRWTLNHPDKFVLGDFHRIGNDSDVNFDDLITDKLTDIFIHNGQATGMLSLNFPLKKTGEMGSQMDLTWLNESKILFRQ